MLRKYFIPILIMIIVIGGALIGYTIYRDSKFRVVSTSPDAGNFPASLSIIDINFNRDLAGNDEQDFANAVQVNFDSAVTTTIKGKVLTLEFTQTPDIGEYEIRLQNIAATDGSTYTGDVAFNTRDIPYEELSDRDKARLDAMGGEVDIDTDVNTAYPIFKKLPYETDQYKVSGAYNEDAVAPVLTISMKFFEPGSNAVPATAAEREAYLADIRTYRRQALAWLESQSVKLSEYQLVYSEPDLINEFPQGTQQ